MGNAFNVRQAVADAYWGWVRGYTAGVGPAREAALLSKLESRAAEAACQAVAEQLGFDYDGV